LSLAFQAQLRLGQGFQSGWVYGFTTIFAQAIGTSVKLLQGVLYLGEEASGALLQGEPLLKLEALGSFLFSFAKGATFPPLTGGADIGL
jgi:hypothetical protein